MNKNELIKRHANRTWEALYTVLDLYGIKYGIDYTGLDVSNSVMVMSYTLKMTNTSKWKALQSIATEITQAAQLDNDNRVRVSFNGLDYRLEVPKPKALYNPANIGKVFKGSTGMNVSLGLSAYSNKPSTVDFSHDTSGHMLISGSTRCGKTNILKMIAMCLMYKNNPDNMRIAIIDTKKAKGKYSALMNSSHLATEIINTEAKAIAFLTWIKDMLTKLEGRKYDKKIIILVDEVFLLLKNQQVKNLLAYIASAGAESGFHLVAATQYATVDEIGGRQFKGNLMTRVVGRVDDHYSSKSATGKDNMGAENLMAPGDFIVVNQNGVERIAVPEMFDSYFKNVKRGMSPLMKLNWSEQDVGLIPEEKVRAPSMAACFDKMDPRLLHLAIYGKNNRTKRPYGADVIRASSEVLAKKGLGKSIGQSTAQQYVNFAKKIRSVK